MIIIFEDSNIKILVYEISIKEIGNKSFSQNIAHSDDASPISEIEFSEPQNQIILYLTNFTELTVKITRPF